MSEYEYVYEYILERGAEVRQLQQRKFQFTGLRKFRSFYGIPPDVLSILWKRIKNKPPGSEPKHLLWCMLFLKNYNKEHINASITNVDEKTFRLWVWRFIQLLADLNVVGYNVRLQRRTHFK